MSDSNWQAEYAQCKQFADARGWFIDKHYICQGDLVVGISKERPFHRKACFSYRREKPLEDSLAWIEKILNG